VEWIRLAEEKMKGIAVTFALIFLASLRSHAQLPFKPVSVVDAPAIQGRPVELDAKGKLLPWPMPQDTGASYQSYFLTQWSYLRQQYHGQRYYYFYCCVDYDRETFATFPDRGWANSTGYLRAMMQGFVEHLYPYTGDHETIELLEDFVDYELIHGTTPREYAWSNVPYASADPGAEHYTGWSAHAVDFLEPPIVGEDGYAYLRLYEMTGRTRYLHAAQHCADALVKNYRKGDAAHSPWPVRVYARDGVVGEKNMGEYSADVIDPIALFDELIRLNVGDVLAYKRVRGQALEWLREFPMKNNVWVGYFEDVAPSMDNMNSVIPLETARYLILNPDKDPEWRSHAAKLIDWVKTTPNWPKYIVHGATVTTEQGNGKNFCCQEPNWCCDSHTARLAAVEALYFARTGDAEFKEQAFRSFNWVTYFQGFPPKGHTPWGQGQWWFTDEFTDGPRRMMDGFWAVPSWAPDGESHFLGSSSVVTSISYDRGSVTYATFDTDATDVLKLNFVPTAVFSGGHTLEQKPDLLHDGYLFDPATQVLEIHHEHARDIDIEGDGGSTPLQFVDFDHPHLASGTVLNGQYPSGVIDWGENQWQIGAPEGRLSTFHLKPVDLQASRASFSFPSPRVFAGFDAFNRSSSDVALTIHSPHNPDLAETIPAGQLRRIRTNWRDRTTRVSFAVQAGANLGTLSFDNLAFTENSAVTPGTSDATQP
jgi:hypothetical protein